MHVKEVERTEDAGEKRRLLLDSARQAGCRLMQVRGCDLEAALTADASDAERDRSATAEVPAEPAASKPARKSRKKAKSNAT